MSVLYNWYQQGAADRSVTAFDADWLEILVGRYQETAARYEINGHDDWLEYWRDITEQTDLWRPAPMPLRTVRHDVCVFISHKQEDERKARDVAQWAIDAGHDVWLDVLNPWLKAAANDPNANSRAIAAIIEMGLINSTHVLAIMTQKTPPSRWVPYEYGRIRDNATLCGNAACWKTSSDSIPGYQQLGPVHSSGPQVQNWLRRI